MRKSLRLLAASLAGFFVTLVAQPAAAQSDSAQLEGSARAAVVEPAGITAINDLRFGAIMQPATPGAIVIGTNDAISATGGASAGITTPQFTGPRGAGAFAITGDAGRFFLVFGLNSLTISNGSDTMTVDQLRSNLFFGFGRFDAGGNFLLRVGGRLNVGANQPTGEYTGTYDVTVLYL